MVLLQIAAAGYAIHEKYTRSRKERHGIVDDALDPRSQAQQQPQMRDRSRTPGAPMIRGPLDIDVDQASMTSEAPSHELPQYNQHHLTTGPLVPPQSYDDSMSISLSTSNLPDYASRPHSAARDSGSNASSASGPSLVREIALSDPNGGPTVNNTVNRPDAMPYITPIQRIDSDGYTRAAERVEPRHYISPIQRVDTMPEMQQARGQERADNHSPDDHFDAVSPLSYEPREYRFVIEPDQYEDPQTLHVPIMLPVAASTQTPAAAAPPPAPELDAESDTDSVVSVQEIQRKPVRVPTEPRRVFIDPERSEISPYHETMAYAAPALYTKSMQPSEPKAEHLESARYVEPETYTPPIRITSNALHRLDSAYSIRDSMIVSPMDESAPFTSLYAAPLSHSAPRAYNRDTMVSVMSPIVDEHAASIPRVSPQPFALARTISEEEPTSPVSPMTPAYGPVAWPPRRLTVRSKNTTGSGPEISSNLANVSPPSRRYSVETINTVSSLHLSQTPTVDSDERVARQVSASRPAIVVIDSNQPPHGFI